MLTNQTFIETFQISQITIFPCTETNRTLLQLYFWEHHLYFGSTGSSKALASSLVWCMFMTLKFILFVHGRSRGLCAPSPKRTTNTPVTGVACFCSCCYYYKLQTLMEDIGIVSWKGRGRVLSGKWTVKYYSNMHQVWQNGAVFPPFSFGCKMNCFDLINCDGYANLTWNKKLLGFNFVKR